MTGDFTEGGLVDDVSELSPTQMLHLNNWLSFYQKNYAAVGMFSVGKCLITCLQYEPVELILYWGLMLVRPCVTSLWTQTCI